MKTQEGNQNMDQEIEIGHAIRDRLPRGSDGEALEEAIQERLRELQASHPSQALIELAQRVAGLNVSAGEIGAGMLSQLVQQANDALAKLHRSN